MKTDENKILQFHVVRTITNFVTKSVGVVFVVDRLACVVLRSRQNDVFTTKTAIGVTLMKR